MKQPDKGIERERERERDKEGGAAMLRGANQTGMKQQERGIEKKREKEREGGAAMLR